MNGWNQSLKKNLDVKSYDFKILGNFDDGGFHFTAYTFEKLMYYINLFKSDGVSIISCKFLYKGETVRLLIRYPQKEIEFWFPEFTVSEIIFLIDLDAEIDIEEMVKELDLI